MRSRFQARIVVGVLVAALLAAMHAHAAMSAEELTRLARNPVANLISLPFQNSTNLNFGSKGKMCSTSSR
jgi:hypothetical protein